MKMLSFVLGCWFLLSGFLPPRHSSIQVSIQGQEEIKKQNIELKFQVVPNENMEIASEGPWKLELTQIKGVALPSRDGKYTSRDFQKSMSGFLLTGKQLGPSVSFHYKLNSFICTKDKSRCYPEVHEGKYPEK